MKSKRNASIELLRFIAAIVVVSVHFGQFNGVEAGYFRFGYVFVEMFFMITGFFMMKSILDRTKLSEAQKTEGMNLNGSQSGELREFNAPQNAVLYSFKKAKSIYAAYFMALIFTFIVRMITMNITDIGEMFSQLFHFKWEFLMVQMLGFNPDPAFNTDYLMGAGWYLSSMFIAMIPAYFFASRFTKGYLSVIAPLSAVCFYCFTIQQYGTLDVGNQIALFTMLGNLRAFAGLSLGAFVYFIYTKAKEREFGKTGCTIFNIVEILCIASLPLMVILRTKMTDADSLFYLLIFSIMLITGSLNITSIDRFLNDKIGNVSAYLGRLSLYMFLFHWGVNNLWAQYLHEFLAWSSYIVYLLTVFVFSALMMAIIDKFKARRKGQKNEI